MLIGNTCSAAYAYGKAGIKYNHPFMWNSIYAKDFYTLITEFNNIDFKEIKAAYKLFPRDNIEKPCITIDNKVNVFYIHYSLDEVETHYLQRVDRLTEVDTNKILFAYSMFDNINENVQYVEKLADLKNVVIYGYKPMDGLFLPNQENIYNDKLYDDELMEGRIQLKHDKISDLMVKNYKDFIL